MPRDSDYIAFQIALVEARQQTGLTQAELSVRIRKPQSYVSKYECGERRLDVIEFLQVCRALKIDPSDILRAVKVSNG